MAERSALYNISPGGVGEARQLVNDVANAAGIQAGDYDPGVVDRVLVPEIAGRGINIDFGFGAPNTPEIVETAAGNRGGIVGGLAPGLVTTGDVLTDLGEAYQSAPAAVRATIENTALLVDVASGPVAFGVRKAIEASPIGSFYQSQKDLVASSIADQIEQSRPGQYSIQQTTRAGAGAVGLLEFGMFGAASALRSVVNIGRQLLTDVKPGQVASAYPRDRRVGGRGEGVRPTDPPSGTRESGAFDLTTENVRLMEAGRPPIGRDGFPVELHHRNQDPLGPLDEYTSTTHDTIDHPESPSRIDRNQFAGERSRYWRERVRGLFGQE